MGWLAPASGDEVVRRTLLTALALLAVIGLSSCAAASSGGLRYADEGNVWCFESGSYKDAAIGIPVQIHQGGPVTIREVSGDQTGSVKLVKAYVMPVHPENRIGSSRWPLEEKWASEWRRATAASGAMVSPKKSTDLILHIERTSSAGGSLKDVVVKYEQDGHQYQADTHTTAQIRKSCG